MRVLVSGSTGLVGSALVTGLAAADHEPVRLIRTTDPGDLPVVRWDPEAGRLDADALIGVDAVVHLAGEGIAERRWSDAQKSRILASRVKGTTLLAERIADAATPPQVMLSGSAIGYYGERGDEVLDEQSATGDGFLARVAREWEGATSAIPETDTRVAHLRTGIVLSATDGALAQLLPFFRLGLGGRIGDGRQWWSWIGVDDMVAAIVWLLDHDAHGPVDLTAPNPVTNATFTSILGDVLGRPTFLPTPKPALWARLGRELTEELLYTSQRVAPSVLLDGGFEFRHAELEPALRQLLDRPR